MLSEKYSFVLKFDELDEDLQNEKIDNVIIYDFNNGEFEENDDLDELLENPEVREKTKNYIENYFPLYF